MSFPRTVSWPVFQPGWSHALTELTTMSLGITFVCLGRHGGYLAIRICICHANVQPVSLLSGWILYFVGLLCNIAHGHTTCKVLQAHCEQMLLLRSSTLQIESGFKVLDLCGYL